MADRTYNEDEISRLIKRAAELEAERSASGRGNIPEGLTLNELEQIASESGIDPELLKQAARELESGADRPQEPAEIKKNEIVCERWLDLQADGRLMDDLITELDQKFGTSHKDVNWWDNLWNNYAGKAKVRKTTHSAEWEYMDELELYTIRVLLQNRGERFRIRVSKRMGWGMNWDVSGKNYWTYLPLGIVLSVVGALAGYFLFDAPAEGVLAGMVITAIAYPFLKRYSKNSVLKHQAEVTDTANELADFTIKISHELKTAGQASKKRTQSDDYIKIEIRDENESENNTQPGSGLKNNLRS